MNYFFLYNLVTLGTPNFSGDRVKSSTTPVGVGTAHLIKFTGKKFKTASSRGVKLLPERSVSGNLNFRILGNLNLRSVDHRKKNRNDDLSLTIG